MHKAEAEAEAEVDADEVLHHRYLRQQRFHWQLISTTGSTQVANKEYLLAVLDTITTIVANRSDAEHCGCILFGARVQCSVFGASRILVGRCACTECPCTWYQVPGIRRLIPGIRYLVTCTCHLVPSTWYPVPCTCTLVQCAWTLAPFGISPGYKWRNIDQAPTKKDLVAQMTAWAMLGLSDPCYTRQNHIDDWPTEAQVQLHLGAAADI